MVDHVLALSVAALLIIPITSTSAHVEQGVNRAAAALDPFCQPFLAGGGTDALDPTMDGPGPEQIRERCFLDITVSGGGSDGDGDDYDDEDGEEQDYPDDTAPHAE